MTADTSRWATMADCRLLRTRASLPSRDIRQAALSIGAQVHIIYAAGRVIRIVPLLKSFGNKLMRC
jgi:hypothetical protein